MLLIGYGNPGRGDDGLGPAFSETMAAKGLPSWEIDTDYQLVAEHAFDVSQHDLVVFADAEIGASFPYSFREIKPGAPEVLGSHSLVPETVLALCQTLYGAEPRAYLLGISGKDFGEIKEGLSAEAQANLVKAEGFFLDWAGKLSAGMT
ncbi:hydrogenase maturation protease [Roseibium sp.]|uniref:hydrogenase maturation protease n=1 Tax=Roseibium sp. TaxID=1936156 RepID=UPI003B522D46